MKRLRSALALASILALTMFVPSAHAVLELRLQEGAGPVTTILDGGAGDVNPNVNVITFIGAVGAWTVNTTTGTSKLVDSLDLNSLDVASPSAGVLTLMLSDDGYTPGQNGFMFHIGGTQTGNNALLTAAAYGGNSNTKFDTTNQLGSTLTFNSTPFSGLTFGSAGAPADPYALTIVTSLSFAGRGQASFDAAIDPVPEPSSVALLGGVLLATAGAIRRKLRKA